MNTIDNNADGGKKFDLRALLSKVNISAIPALMLFLTAFFIPEYDKYRLRHYEWKTILGGCFDSRIALFQQPFIILIIAPIVGIVMYFSPKFRRFSCIPFIVGAFFALMICIAPENAVKEARIANFYSGTVIYLIFAITLIWIHYMKKPKSILALISSSFAAAAFFSFLSLPSFDLGFKLPGSGLIKLIESDSRRSLLFPYLFCGCPWIAVFINLLNQNRISRIISSVVLLLPWLIMLFTLPEHLDLAIGMFWNMIFSLMSLALGLYVNENTFKFGEAPANNPL